MPTLASLVVSDENHFWLCRAVKTAKALTYLEQPWAPAELVADLVFRASPRTLIPWHHYDEVLNRLLAAQYKVEVVPDKVRKLLRSPPLPPKPFAELEERISLWPRLKDYQKEGVAQIIGRNGNTMLCDDPGLGKTIQAMAVLEYYKTDVPVMVVCPASVVQSWRDHIIEFLQVTPHVLKNWKVPIDPDGINLVSIGLLASKKFSHQTMRPRTLIVDESHMVKNAKAKRSKAVEGWCKWAKHRLLLSGTPMNRPRELFSQVKCIYPKLFPVYFKHRFYDLQGAVIWPETDSNLEFVTRYCRPKVLHLGRHKHVEDAYESRAEELSAILRRNVLIRRTKQQVLPELPPKIRESINVDAWQQKGLPEDPLEAEGGFSERVKETGLHKLPKVIRYLQEVVKEELINDPSLKVLVWAHHHEVLDELKVVLQKIAPTVCMDGRSSRTIKDAGVLQFQTDPDTRFALMGITAMCTGITLTQATLELVVEMPLTPDVLLQAEDRAHRIGQEDPVVIRYLLCRGSTDDLAMQLIKTKVLSSTTIVDGEKKALDLHMPDPVYTPDSPSSSVASGDPPNQHDVQDPYDTQDLLPKPKRRRI